MATSYRREPQRVSMSGLLPVLRAVTGSLAALSSPLPVLFRVQSEMNRLLSLAISQGWMSGSLDLLTVQTNPSQLVLPWALDQTSHACHLRVTWTFVGESPILY